MVRKRPLTVFFFIAYLWTWCAWLMVPRLVRQRGLNVVHGDELDVVIMVIGSFGPMVAALVTRWSTDRDLKICPLWTGYRRLLTGLGSGFAAFFTATVLLPAVAMTKASPFLLHWSALAHWATYGINYSTFLGGPVGEEPGWRGFALPKLQARFGTHSATVILAVLWAGWHMPLFLMPDWSSASFWQFLLILVGVSMVLTFSTNIARFGVVVPILLHAFFNISSSLLGALVADLPVRAGAITIYTFVVFVFGVLFAVVTFRAGCGISSPKEPPSRQLRVKGCAV